MIKETQTSTETTRSLFQRHSHLVFKQAPKATRESRFPTDSLQTGPGCPHTGHPLARPPPPGSLCNLRAGTLDPDRQQLRLRTPPPAPAAPPVAGGNAPSVSRAVPCHREDRRTPELLSSSSSSSFISHLPTSPT